MIRLRETYRGKKAVVVFGGPSLVANGWDLSKINNKDVTVFLESKALTPYLLKSELVPDYYMMFYPEKCKSNAFQEVVFQSFLSGIDLSGLLKPDFEAIYNQIKGDFDRYFEPWKSKIIHKKYRYKKDVFLPGSPFDLLSLLPTMPLITFNTAFNAQFTSFPFPNPLHRFQIDGRADRFDVVAYFLPSEKDGVLTLKEYGFLNSAAIALYPLLSYMGFGTIFFLGMDMSMLGSMEYAACYTFKSMRHFGIFYKRARRIFNYSFKPQWSVPLKALLKLGVGPIPARCFLRPVSEFENLSKVFKYEKIEFVNVYEPFRYAVPVKGIRNITYKQFLEEA